MRHYLSQCTVLVCLASLVMPAATSNSVRPGRLTVEPPTLICLGFEWEIEGDANRNASVEVTYRQPGAAEWKQALPLLRMGGERVGRPGERLDYVVPHKFAGSIMDLRAGAEYEVRLTMKDPDGVSGVAVETRTVRTRSEPKAAAGGRVLHVYPPNWKGPLEKPAYRGLYQAYQGSGGFDFQAADGAGDWNIVSERKVQPGDTILMHGGLYRSEPLNYVDPLNVPFEGTYVLTSKGTRDRPVVIRAAGDGEVVIDGNGSHVIFNLMAADYHIFEEITFRDADIAMLAGLKEVAGAAGLTVLNCRFEQVGAAITTTFAGSRDFYIADNIILGRADRFRLVGWSLNDRYGSSDVRSYIGVTIYGSGHVVCHNAFAYFWDAVTLSTYGSPQPGHEAVAIDIYNNLVHMVNDDFIESDGGVHNIRVMRNLGVNAAHNGFSAQPVFGGPAYFIRNVVYRSRGALKFADASPAGLIVYHNTFIAEVAGARHSYSNVHYRNNLFLGADTANKPIAVFRTATDYSTFDYDGFRPNRGVARQFQWFPLERAAAHHAALTWEEALAYPSLRAFSEATGHERHGLEVDYDVFEDLRQPDLSRPNLIYHASDLNFSLKPGSKAVDAGLRLPNVNDDYTGQAPDLGARELGRPVPVYGPRGMTSMAFYR